MDGSDFHDNFMMKSADGWLNGYYSSECKTLFINNVFTMRAGTMKEMISRLVKLKRCRKIEFVNVCSSVLAGKLHNFKIVKIKNDYLNEWQKNYAGVWSDETNKKVSV
jgi:hypothetical protein